MNRNKQVLLRSRSARLCLIALFLRFADHFTAKYFFEFALITQRILLEIKIQISQFLWFPFSEFKKNSTVFQVSCLTFEVDTSLAAYQVLFLCLEAIFFCDRLQHFSLYSTTRKLEFFLVCTTVNFRLLF